MSAKKTTGTFGIDDYVDYALAEAEKAFGKERCYVAAEHEAKQLVMPIKPLSLCWLIESNGWPLGRITQCGGEYGTQKSSFIFQLISWCLELGGMSQLIDTEYKTSGNFIESMVSPEFFDAENPLSKRLQLRVADSVGMWQQMVTNAHRSLKAKIDANKSVPSFPIVWAVDSILGSAGEAAKEHVESTGEGEGRAFPVHALQISNYMKALPGMFIGLPVVLHISHHEKPKVGGLGMGRSGGKAPDFHTTLDLQFKRGGETAFGKQYEANRSGFTFKSITIAVRKSSMGSDVDKKLPVAFCWRFEGTKQTSWWDWDGATAMVLAKNAKALADILEVSCEKVRGGHRLWSSSLSIPKTSALSAQEFAQAVESIPDLRTAIEDALHIRRHPTVVGDCPSVQVRKSVAIGVADDSDDQGSGDE